MEHIIDDSTVGCQESKVIVFRRRMLEKNIYFSNFDGPLLLQERRTFKTPPGIQGASCAPEGNAQDEEGHRAVFTDQAKCFSVSDGSSNILRHYLDKLHQTENYRQCCHVENQMKDCNLVLVKMLHCR